MKKIIIFLLLISSICIFGKEKKEYEPYLIRNGEKLLSYNDDKKMKSMIRRSMIQQKKIHIIGKPILKMIQ